MTVATYLLLGYLIGAVGVVYILLCGDSDFHRTGCIGTLHQWLTWKLWVVLRKYGIKLLGPSCWKRVDMFGDWCCNSRNPLMQFFYLSLVLGGALVFFLYAYPFIPGPYLPDWHRYGFVAFLGATLYFFWNVCRKDPGTITAENVHEHLATFPYDNQIFNQKYCDSCKVYRPARSKHCRICKRCVARFDHHCAWLNSDVGLFTIRDFLIFLLVTALLCTYASWMCYQILKGVVVANQLYDLKYTDDGGIEKAVPKSYVVQFLLFHMGPVCGLGAFTAMIGLVLYFFLLYHLYLIFINTTTNESFKWKDLRWAMKELEREKELAASKTGKAHDAVPKVSARKLVNIYNRGFFANFMEALLPYSIYAKGPQQANGGAGEGGTGSATGNPKRLSAGKRTRNQ